MKTTFFAVRNGRRADGFLVVGREMFDARSGRNIADIPPAKLAADRAAEKADPKGHFGFDDERGDIPPGQYRLGEGTRLSGTNWKTMSPSPSPNTPRGGGYFKKFPILPTESNKLGSGIHDSRYGNKAADARTEILFHYDGDVQGSAGCIVYDVHECQLALEKAYSDNHRDVEVIHVNDQTTARNRALALVAERTPAVKAKTG